MYQSEIYLQFVGSSLAFQRRIARYCVVGDLNMLLHHCTWNTDQTFPREKLGYMFPMYYMHMYPCSRFKYSSMIYCNSRLGGLILISSFFKRLLTFVQRNCQFLRNETTKSIFFQPMTPLERLITPGIRRTDIYTKK